jgi:hypothetical protein
MTEENKTPPRPLKPEEDISWRLLATEINISNIFHHIEIMTKTLQKLDTAYYEMFPDRLDKDQQFDAQLRALKKINAKPAAPRMLDELRALRKKAESRNPHTPRKKT